MQDRVKNPWFIYASTKSILVVSFYLCLKKGKQILIHIWFTSPPKVDCALFDVHFCKAGIAVSNKFAFHYSRREQGFLKPKNYVQKKKIYTVSENILGVLQISLDLCERITPIISNSNNHLALF